MKYIFGPLLLLSLLSITLAHDQGSETDQTQVKAKPTPSKRPTTQKSSIATKSSPPAKKATPQKSTGNSKAQTGKVGSEPEEYAKAESVEDPEKRVAALKAYLEKFPLSIRKAGVLESIAITRIKLAQDKLTAAEIDSGIELLKVAIKELPVPVPERLYKDSISKIPIDLLNNGQANAAADIAALIETKVAGNTSQMLSLANFFLMTENGSEAGALAEKAIAISPSAAAYQTLGLANRLSFQLDDALQAYAKALEMEPGSPAILRSLADLKRAEKKPDEAIELYRQILEKDAANIPAQTGLVLALFDAGKRADAETEMARSLEQNPDNIILLAGSAYWYAAHNEPDKAIENAQKAIDNEPHYIWSHIALAHGYLAKKQPADAERTLLRARNYGNFPTLQYELASARLMSGFFKDAAEELRKSFSIKDGVIHSKLGGRVDVEGNSFLDVLAGERRSSTFEPDAADDPDTAARLKALLEFDGAVNTSGTTDEALGKAADLFITGDDNMKLHRQLYVATTMLAKQLALSKVTELADAAVGNTDAALDVPDPAAAVMASELYDSRALALSRNEMLEMPRGVPRSTLSAILRGRVEEIAGWALFNQNKTAEAVIRLKRAVSVMPDKSAWWRASMWRLGAALQADGKDAEALDSYIRSYSIDKPSAAKYVVVEALYRKVKGSTEGLEKRIGVNPAQVAQLTDVSTPEKVPPPQTSVVDMDNASKSAAKPTPRTELTIPKNVPVAAIQSTPTPEVAAPTPEPLPAPVEAKPSPTVEATPVPEIAVSPTPTPASVPETTPSPTPESLPEPTPTATPQPPVIEATPSPTPDVQATPTPEQAPTTVAAASSPTPEVQSTPRPDPTPMPEPSPMTTEKTAEPKTEQVAQSKLVDIRPSYRKDKNATAVRKTEGSSAGKPLFEPIIITIPKPEKGKTAESEDGTKSVNTERSSDVDKEKDLVGGVIKKTSDPPLQEQTSASPEGNKTATSTGSPEDKTSADENMERPTVIVGNPGKIPQKSTCTIGVSQESISILNNGGSLGILVRMDGRGELRSVKAVSNSPDDLEIKLEPEIAGVRGQAFYVVRSVTPKTGDFTVAFIAPCGRKEMAVKVR